MFKKSRIGQTDVFVSDVSFGCSSIANLSELISEEQSADLLQYAWDQGLRYFDTAPHYGRGRSEQRLGHFLRDKNRTDIQVSTKVGRVLTPGDKRANADGFLDPLPNDMHYDYSASGIEQSLVGSFERLGTEYLDIVYVHDIGEYTHGPQNAQHIADLIETGLPFLEQMKREGVIGAYGLGVNENQVCIDLIKQARFDVILLAGRLTLLDRSSEKELLPLCAKNQTSIVVGGVFNSGILATGPKEGAWFDYAPASDDIRRLVSGIEIHLVKHSVDLPTAALQYVHSHKQVASMLLGTGKISSLSRNIAALTTNINQNIFNEIKSDLLIF